MRNLGSFPSYAVLGTLTLVLAGCPIWSDHDGDEPCFDCCYEKDCYVETCTSPSQCGFDEVCGTDNECHFGDCGTWGCPFGFVCDDTFECVPEPGSGGGGEGGGGEGGGVQSTWCGNPADCGSGQYCSPNGTCQDGDCSFDGCIYGFVCDTLPETPVCMRENPFGCGSDADCALVDGQICVSGICTAPENLCFDQTQCVAGSVCAEGKCTPSCDAGAVCPIEYSCTAVVELCTTAASPCTITNDCGGPDHVCVEGACVPRSIDGTCASGTAWVNNGCIPDQAAIFVCAIDGTQDVCAAGSVCLHHSCYISCDAPNQTACEGLPGFDVCKSVTTPSGVHDVCGSEDNLGGQCDPTAGMTCQAGLICVDGFCK